MSSTQLRDRDLLREAEYRKAKASFAYFFANFWTVIYRNATMRPLVRQAQIDACHEFQYEKRLIVVKARQIGWSTMSSAYLFWLAFHNDSHLCLALSRREDPEARDIIKKVRLGYAGLPTWYRKRGPSLTNSNMTKVEFSNNSGVDSDASSESAGRSRTLACLLMDEFGKFPNPADAWQSALPAVEFGQAFVIGNANGWGTYFHTQYLAAKAGQSEFKPLFYGWRDGGDDRTDEWLAKETKSYTPAQRAAEYPDDDIECWIQAGSPRFETDRLKEISTRPGVRCIFTPMGPRPDPTGEWEIWHDEPMAEHKYVLGGDPSGGGENGDFGSLQVLSATTGAHVAEFHGRLTPSSLAAEASMAGRWYNNALIVPERNNENGVAFIDALQKSQHYPKIYRERKFGYRQNEAGSMRYGFQTTTQTKAMALDHLWKLIIEGDLISESAEWVTEMIGYKYLANGTTGGDPHDDRVMGMAMAAVGLRFVGESRQGTPDAPEADDTEERTGASGEIHTQTWGDFIYKEPKTLVGAGVARYPERFSLGPRTPSRSRRYP